MPIPIELVTLDVYNADCPIAIPSVVLPFAPALLPIAMYVLVAALLNPEPTPIDIELSTVLDAPLPIAIVL